MNAIEVTGKSLAEATQEAARLLGTSPDNIEVTVLEETKGLFGRGTVRISASAKSDAGDGLPAPEPKPKGRARKTAKGKETPEPEPQLAIEAAEPSEEASEPATDVIATEADGQAVIAIVQDLLRAGEFNVSAHVASLNGRYVNVELDGEGKELGYLVGKNGEVLNALQYLLNIIVSQQLKNGVRITLDANNYRQRREAALTKYAAQIAEEVRARKEEAVLDPLPAFERRIIHKALAEIEGVSTYSEGEEPNRRVVIAPAE